MCPMTGSMASSHLALDLRRHSPPLTCNKDPELVIGRRVVAAMTFVGDDALDGVADERFHIWDHGLERMTV
jgi:hypothetical protein